MTSNANQEGLLTSPVGTIQYMAIKNKVRNKPTDEEASVYTVRLEFDGNTEEGKAYKKTVEGINSALIGTKNASQKGNFTVKASTKWYPKVIDSTGELITQEEAPVFYPKSTGQAAMTVKAFTGNSLGGSLNLVGIAISHLDLAEKPEESGQGGASAEIVERLRAAIAKS